MKRSRVYCPPDKQAYTKERAKAAVLRARRYGIFLRKYYCVFGSHYHLTHARVRMRGRRRQKK